MPEGYQHRAAGRPETTQDVNHIGLHQHDNIAQDLSTLDAVERPQSLDHVRLHQPHDIGQDLSPLVTGEIPDEWGYQDEDAVSTFNPQNSAIDCETGEFPGHDGNPVEETTLDTGGSWLRVHEYMDEDDGRFLYKCPARSCGEVFPSKTTRKSFVKHTLKHRNELFNMGHYVCEFGCPEGSADPLARSVKHYTLAGCPKLPLSAVAACREDVWLSFIMELFDRTGRVKKHCPKLVVSLV